MDGLLEVTHKVQHAVSVVAARHDLTPQQVALLRMLDKPVSMRTFAEDMACDPSNVTGLVDRGSDWNSSSEYRPPRTAAFGGSP